MLGEHTHEVLAELGCSDERLARAFARQGTSLFPQD
jgi:crotonobetainyl-CoA:carnitine CoA-transferase CaiB-like acyl-CoA transferase